MNKYKDLIIIGAGGHGRVVADTAARTGNYQSISFLDDIEFPQTFPYPYLGKCDTAEKYLDAHDIVVAIGNGEVRQKIMLSLAEHGAHFATIIAPDSIVAADVSIGAGTVVLPGAVINTGTVIGKGVIINTASSVDHDCRIDDFCHVAVGAHICGTVSVGQRSWVGAGVTVINNVTICSDCMIGAGAVVVNDIETNGIYVGVPAKRQRRI